MAYYCNTCDERFPRKPMLDRHTCSSTSSKNDLYKCDDCEMDFSNKELLLKHDCKSKNIAVEASNRPPLVKCQYCGAQFTNTNTLKVHERIHTGDMPYKCLECGEKFPYHSNLRSHMRIHNDPIDRPHKCVQCGAKFSQIANLHAHERTHETDRTTTCDKCKGLVPENCRHVCPKDAIDPYFKCVECGARFTVKNTLEVHMRTHTGERPYKCTQCNERFIQPGALQSHLRTHTTSLDHECGECGQRFANENKLRDHIRTHAQVTIHKCSVCQAAFAAESRLVLHMEQKHVTVDKRTKCSQCSESFVTDSELQSHVQSKHSNADSVKYKCSECADTFTTFAQLQIHVRDIHPSPHSDLLNSDYRCDDCGCKYTTPNRLIAHRRAKHPDKSVMLRKSEPEVTATRKLSDSPSERQTDPLLGQNSTESIPKVQNLSPTHDNELKKELHASGNADDTSKGKKQYSDAINKKESTQENTKTFFKCKTCVESFDNMYQLHIHEQGHKFEKDCDECGSARCTCPADHGLPRKKRRTHTIYRCARCKCKCASRKKLREHKCKAKGRTIAKKFGKHLHSHPSPKLRNVTMHKCPECDIQFTRLHLLELHVFTAHKMSYRNCNMCNERYCCSVQRKDKPDEHKNKLDICSKCTICEKSTNSNVTDTAEKGESITTEVGGQPVDTEVPHRDEHSIRTNQNGDLYQNSDSNVMSSPKISKSTEGGPFSSDRINPFAGSNGSAKIEVNFNEPGDDDDEDDTIGAPIIEVKTVSDNSQFLEILASIKTEAPEELKESNCNAPLPSWVEDMNAEPTNVSMDTGNCSLLSQLVPKLVRVVALNVEGAKLEDFGWPTASPVELMERVVSKFGGVPTKNCATDDEALAANCKEFIILSVGTEEAEKMLEEQSIEEVVANVIVNGDGNQLGE